MNRPLGHTYDMHGHVDSCELCEYNRNPNAWQRRIAVRDATLVQPTPEPNDNPPIYRLVEEDLIRRARAGTVTYGTPLQANNGRDALRDLYEELLDGAQYARQLLFERDGV